MRIKVLGSAAGGGFPQWNCNCSNCADVRLGRGGLEPRTQASIAVTTDGRSWCLVNASPDLGRQIDATRELQPHGTDAARSSPIAGVVLTGAEVDQVAGLLALREGHAFHLYAAMGVLETLAANPIFNVLADVVQRKPVRWHEPFEPAGCKGLSMTAFPVPGKAALYLEEGRGGDREMARADAAGLRIEDRSTGRHACYVPGCSAIDASVRERVRGAAVLLFDGTLFADDEMIAQGLSQKTGGRMGHISISGEMGSVAALRGVDAGRRIFTHINNSNPVLRPGSRERTWVEGAGWEIASDGMEIVV